MVFEKIRKADREEYLAMEHDFYHSPAVLHPIPDENHKLTFDVLMEGSPYTVCFMFRSDDKKEVYGFALLALTYSNEAGEDEKTPLAIVVVAENGGLGIGVAGKIANTVLQQAKKLV